MSANNHTCIGDQIFGSTVETKTWDRKNVRALHTNSSAADPHFTCKCCVYVFSWEWNSIIIQRDHQSQSSTNCLGVSWVTAVTVGKSECAYVCVCVVTAVSDGSQRGSLLQAGGAGEEVGWGCCLLIQTLPFLFWVSKLLTVSSNSETPRRKTRLQYQGADPARG